MSNYGHRPSSTFLKNAQAFPNGFRAHRAFAPPTAPVEIPTAAEYRESIEASIARHPSSTPVAGGEAPVPTVPPVEAPEPTPAPIETSRFDGLTRAELRTEAKRLGIVGQGRMLKDDLLAAVKAAAESEVITAA